MLTENSAFGTDFLKVINTNNLQRFLMEKAHILFVKKLNLFFVFELGAFKMCLWVRWLLKEVGMGGFLKWMGFNILLKFLFFGSFRELKWGVFMRSFGFGGFSNPQKRSVNRKEFDIVGGHLAANVILGTCHIMPTLCIWGDFALNTSFTKGMTTSSKNPGDPFFRIFNPTERTRELSFHPK
jgi:hypothetical protein